MQLTRLLLGLALSGCAATATVQRLGPHAYRIECVKRPSCERKARELCRGGYSVKKVWENSIPDSDLTVQGEKNAPTGVVGPTRAYPGEPKWSEPKTHAGPPLESDQPLPLVALDVECRY